MNNYRNPAHHVANRTAFPEGLKADLIEGRFTDWRAHPQFSISGVTLHAFHNRLRNACDVLTRELGKEVLNFNHDDISHWRLPAFGRQIIDVAHSHHHAEDHYYFPQYRALFPHLERPLRLLDGDHRVLEQQLNELQISLDRLIDNSAIEDWEHCRDIAEHLRHIIHRHLDDEEEIVMPAIMRRDS